MHGRWATLLLDAQRNHEVVGYKAGMLEFMPDFWKQCVGAAKAKVKVQDFVRAVNQRYKTAGCVVGSLAIEAY